MSRLFIFTILSLGVLIHALSLFNIIHPVSFTVDLLMLIVDASAIAGLIFRKSWGYYLAIILFLQQSIMQPYFAYQRYLSGFYMVHPMEWIIVPMLVMACLLILIVNRSGFN